MRYGKEYGVVVNLEHDISQLRQLMTTQRVNSFCNWLGRSAKCHMKERFKASDSDVRLYQKLWNELYFAPLFLSNSVNSSLWDLVDDDVDTARKMVCVQIHEGLFQSDSAQAAVLVLEESLTVLHQIASDLFRAAVDALSIRVPTWLSRHAEGENPRFQHQRRPRYLAELQSVQVELAGMSDDAPIDYETSVYSWELAHDHHLAYVTGCLRSVYNASLNFDNNPGLLLDFAHESALLGPLYDVYRRGVDEGVHPRVYLNQRYTNWQLLFVLWAMSHCGTGSGGAMLVNAAVSNSVRFGRTLRLRHRRPHVLEQEVQFLGLLVTQKRNPVSHMADYVIP
ncbi:hypothetical protein HPB52_007646 [Rhipicephalus sanguineus]|uniref:Uncharacterized protein n=1 Tax=Rhipicephalus sanguineus TaxID=34632 RepID=A0A9D4SPG0_RHISA|nr:hypothetical protein HPB52_007646 [Rhipicephalus sanguineus]